jgi:hypothetical protein
MEHQNNNQTDNKEGKFYCCRRDDVSLIKANRCSAKSVVIRTLKNYQELNDNG